MSVPYKFVNENDEEIVVNVLEEGTQENVYTQFNNWNSLMTRLPNFDSTATIICNSYAKNLLVAFGYPEENILDSANLVGHKWALSNGYYFTFSGDYINCCKPDNTVIWSQNSTITTVSGNAVVCGISGKTGVVTTVIARTDGKLYVNFYPQNTTASGFAEFYTGESPYVPPADPYAQGGTSTTGGGTGTFTIDSDAISIPNPPTLSAVDTGLVSLYTPTLTQLQALAAYLWNADATTVDWWKKLIANPLDLILGLSIVPVAVPTSGAVSVKVGLIDTEIQMNKASSQYVQVDCGTLNVVEFYGAALDYLPFRKTSIYLPFIGTRTISTDDIMGKALQVVYNIDLLSGALTAMIKCGDAVLYQYSGSCAMSIPLTGQTFTDMITSTIQLAAGIGATVASGGAAAGVVAANAANSVMSMKPTVERAGGVSGAAGQLAVMKPYLIGEIPRQSVPENYNEFAGYPSNIKATLSDLSGYTEIETVYLEGIAATDSELNEIETLLKGGVFL